jgi:protein kinase
MNRYEITEKIGDGTFGVVMKAVNKETNSVVAIKQIKKKMKSWAESISLREVQSLRTISHPNIVRMLEVLLESDGSLYFVFEYMADGNLYELIKQCVETQTKLSNDCVASFVEQILNGLAFLHDEKFMMHRDIKPENVIKSGNTIKLADFGLAKTNVGANPPYTYYVSTRWYRAPEVILRSISYGPAIDLFATGCILSELYSLTPLLPGRSEIDQIQLLTDLIGPPTDEDWREGVELIKQMKIRLTSPRKDAQDEVELRIQRRLPKEVPSYAANLIASLLSWNPNVRPSAKECMKHKLFQSPSTTGATQNEIAKVEEKEEEQKHETEICYHEMTVKRSNLSNNSVRKREVFPQNLAQLGTLGDQNNEFSEYLAAVSVQRCHDGVIRFGNKIRSLMYEEETSSFPEDGVTNLRQDIKKKNKASYNRNLYRGIEVQVSNPLPFMHTEDDHVVANIWNATEQTNEHLTF